MTNQQTNSLTSVVAPGTAVATKFLTFDSAPMYSLGAGYSSPVGCASTPPANTAATRISKAAGRAIRHRDSPGDYKKKCEQVRVGFMANAYVRPRHLGCITPFIGAGIGTSRNNITSFSNRRHAGRPRRRQHPFRPPMPKTRRSGTSLGPRMPALAYKVAPGLNLELTYRYINLALPRRGPPTPSDGVTVVNQPGFNFGTLTSQDVMARLPLEPADRVADGRRSSTKG